MPYDLTVIHGTIPSGPVLPAAYIERLLHWQRLGSLNLRDIFPARSKICARWLILRYKEQ